MPALQKPQTLHETILQDLRARIVEGAWKPGFQLPKETELAAQFGVSRMTMNKVLTQLTREGFLLRRKKLGTFVTEPRAQSVVMEITDLESEVAALGKPYRFQLLERAMRPLRPDDVLGTDDETISEKADLLFLRGVHFAGAQPFCLETRLINPQEAEGAVEQDFGNVPPGRWLVETVPWGSARHRIRAIQASAEDARALKISSGDACLEIARRTEAAGVWVTWVRLLYPGDSHQIVADFQPSS